MTMQAIFAALQAQFQQEPYLSYHSRCEQLDALKQGLQQHTNAIVEALHADFSYRVTQETLFLELFPTIKAIDYCKANLKQWMKPRARRTAWYLKTASARILPQPLGLIGIIVPWNYPIYLSMVPLAYALASGNVAMIKLSELTPAVNALLHQMLTEMPCLQQRVSLIEGDALVGEAMTKLPLDHLLFTGSIAVGKKVMQAASANLTPLTLELGGKSPVIISRTLKKQHLNRLFMGKLFNAGQTCIAPDYILLPKEWEASFADWLRDFIGEYLPNPVDNPNYTSIISSAHFERMNTLLLDAKEKGASVLQFGSADEPNRRFPVILLTNVNKRMRVMQEEIFGPIIPVMTYDTFDEVLQIVKGLSKPLALYYFGHNKQEINRLAQETLSGALSINDTLMHIAIDDLPFGGIGDSGMGQYHGKEGFERFSQMKPVFKQGRFSPIPWFYPPYGKLLALFLRVTAGIHYRGKK